MYIYIYITDMDKTYFTKTLQLHVPFTALHL